MKGWFFEGDVLIENDIIVEISESISAKSSDCVIVDAEGNYLPGAIDDQVHFREPGLTHKGDIESESRAAVAGGITSLLSSPTRFLMLLPKKFLNIN
jgi:dihydroorotase